MRSTYILMLVFASIFTSCKNNNTPKATPISSLKPEAHKQLVTLLDNYYALKNALVATDSGKTSQAASKVAEAVKTFQNSLGADDEATRGKINVQLATMSKACDSIKMAVDKSCEKQRLQFSDLSEAMYQLAKDAGLKHASIYRQFCPMAFNEKGAFWLSNESEIKNPYFGKKMLECGEVKDSL